MSPRPELTFGVALALAWGCTPASDTNPDTTTQASTASGSTGSESGGSETADAETGAPTLDLPGEDCELDEGATAQFELFDPETDTPYSGTAEALCTYSGSSLTMAAREHSFSECASTNAAPLPPALSLRTTTTTDFELALTPGQAVRLRADVYLNEGWLVVRDDSSGHLLLAACSGSDFDFNMDLTPLSASLESRDCPSYFDDGGCTLWRPLRLRFTLEDEVLDIVAGQSAQIESSSSYRVDLGRAERNVGEPSCENIPNNLYEFVIGLVP